MPTFSYSNCTKVSGAGSCVQDSNKGCHVENNTVCQESGTPDGCRKIGCTSSCPTRGYYVPYNNSTSWNAWKSNKPATMSNNPCITSCSCPFEPASSAECSNVCTTEAATCGCVNSRMCGSISGCGLASLCPGGETCYCQYDRGSGWEIPCPF